MSIIPCEKKIIRSHSFDTQKQYAYSVTLSVPISDHRLAPSTSNYTKRCYYETLDVADLLKAGKNSLDIEVAQGWRRNHGDYLKYVADKDSLFFGSPQLTAILLISFDSGNQLKIVTDKSWKCKKGNIVSAHLFDGEKYDARISDMPLTVKWKKAYGKINLLVDIPNGSCANVFFGKNEYSVTSGTHVYTIDEDDN